MKSLRTLLAGVLLFLHLPVLALAVFSFSRSRLSQSFDGPSLVWYEKLLANGPLMRAMENSLVVGALTTAIVLLLATAAALGSRHATVRTRGRAGAMFLLPLVTPEIVFGASLLAFFSRLFVPLGLGTVVAAHVVFSLSFAFFVIRARAHALPADVEEAASDLGATPMQVFRRVTLPLLMPGLVGAGLLTFSLSIDDYVVTSFVAGAGGTTLPVYIYSLLKSSLSPEIAAASTLLLAATTLLLLATALIESRPRLAVIAMVAGASILLTPVVLARSQQQGTRELNLYLWSNYIAPQTIRKFEERTGAKVNLDVYDSAEALLSKMLAGNPGYDVICPPTYTLAPLIRAGVLADLDKDRLPHLAGTAADFIGQNWDPQNRHSIPYLWGVTGIASDSRRVPAVDSWNALRDPQWRGRILMLDDAREAVAFGALLLGADPNTRDPETLARIRRILIDQKPLIRAYDSASFDDAVLSGEVLLAQSWSGQIAKIMKDAPWVRFTIPKEGAMLFVDNLAIPTTAPHAALALEFLDFVMEPEIAAEIGLTTGYSTPSRAGRELLPRAMRDNPAMFPSAEDMKRLRAFEDLGDAATLHDRLWTEVKSGGADAMPKYVAFLRAINVGGHVVKMDALRTIFESLGHSDVSTYIASGNVRFESRSKNTVAIEAAIEATLGKALGYEVTTFVRTRAQVAAIAAHEAFPRAAIETAAALNVALLKQPLDDAGVAAVAKLRTDVDDFHLNGAELYWLCARRQSDSKFSNAIFERAVKARATFRGLRTLAAMGARYPA